MVDLELLVPAALVEPSLAAELLAGRQMPHLARMLGRAEAPATTTWPPQGPLTAWQRRVFGEKANVAELWAMASGLAPLPTGGRWLAEPVHFSIARDHLRLDDPAAFELSIAEARELADAAQPALAEAGWVLEPVEPATLRHWFLRRADAADVAGAAVERAIGDNIAAWQPRMTRAAKDTAIDQALAWRRCVNEIQMLWFGHPVNEARESRGVPTINTLWLSGDGGARPSLPHYRAIDASLPLLAALPVEPDATRTLETFDELVPPARREDWGEWRERLADLDARIGNATTRMERGEVGAVEVVLCGRDAVRTVTLAPGDLKRFWRGWKKAPSVIDMLSDPSA